MFSSDFIFLKKAIISKTYKPATESKGIDATNLINTKSRVIQTDLQVEEISDLEAQVDQLETLCQSTESRLLAATNLHNELQTIIEYKTSQIGLNL